MSAKKLTDEQVAKALGWKLEVIRVPGIRQTLEHWIVPRADPFSGFKDREGTCRRDETPRFTTSLDAIVAEVEARGLKPGGALPVPGWSVNCATNGKLGSGYRAHLAFGASEGWSAKSPAEALCRALLAYLKENP